MPVNMIHSTPSKNCLFSHRMCWYVVNNKLSSLKGERMYVGPLESQDGAVYH